MSRLPCPSANLVAETHPANVLQGILESYESQNAWIVKVRASILENHDERNVPEPSSSLAESSSSKPSAAANGAVTQEPTDEAVPAGYTTDVMSEALLKRFGELVEVRLESCRRIARLLQDAQCCHESSV